MKPLSRVYEKLFSRLTNAYIIFLDTYIRLAFHIFKQLKQHQIIFFYDSHIFFLLAQFLSAAYEKI